MKCQNCGADNLEGAKFCEKCGGNLMGTVNKSNKKITFKIVDFFKTILTSVLHPMKAFKKLDEGTIFDDCIYGGVLIVAVSIVNLLITIIHFAIEKVLKYTEVSYFVKLFFSTIGYLILFIALAAFIYKVASLFMKKEVDFKKILAGILAGFTTIILAQYVIVRLGQCFSGKFFEYLVGTIHMFALLYSLFYTIKIVTKDMESNDEKGVMLNIICLTILFALSTYLLSEMFTCSVITL